MWPSSAPKGVRAPRFEKSHRLVIYNRDMARDWEVDPVYAVISITDHGTGDWPVKSGYVDILRLQFGELEPDDFDRMPESTQGLMPLFTPSQADQILDFWERHHATVDRFMIHCVAGAFRSVAIGAALARLEDNGQLEETICGPGTHPSIFIRNTILRAARARHLGCYMP